MDFEFSKIFWAVCSPGNVLTILLLFGSIAAMSRFYGTQSFGRRLTFLIALIFFGIALLPVGDLLLQPLENRFPPEKPDHVDGIIVLGGDENPRLSDERGQPIAFTSMLRYMRVAIEARKYPDATLLFSGGSGLVVPYGKVKDFEVAREAMADMGVPVERMKFENKSRNTYENAMMSAQILHPAPAQKWLLITNAWHMPRAMECYRKAGFNVYADPAGYLSGTEQVPPIQFNLEENLLKTTLAVHEYFGLAAYWLRGYIDKPWP